MNIPTGSHGGILADEAGSVGVFFHLRVPESMAALPSRRHELSDEEPVTVAPAKPKKRPQRESKGMYKKWYATDAERRAARLRTYAKANAKRKAARIAAKRAG